MATGKEDRDSQFGSYTHMYFRNAAAVSFSSECQEIERTSLCMRNKNNRAAIAADRDYQARWIQPT